MRIEVFENNIRGGDYGWFDKIMDSSWAGFAVYKYLLPNYQERFIIVEDRELVAVSHLVDYLFTKMDSALSKHELEFKLLADYGVTDGR